MDKQVCKMKGGRKVAPIGMDRLGAMVQAQAKFASRFFDISKLSQAERERWLKEMCLCMTAETMELLDMVNWKHWRKQLKELDVEQARFEVADMQCFLFNIGILLGMDAEAMYQYYTRKVEINHERQAMQY